MKYFILLINFFYFTSVVTLKCDSYYQYQVGGFQTQSLDNIINGCNGCGYLYSNNSDINNFHGFFSGCLSSTKTLALKYDSSTFNLTKFSEICNKTIKIGMPYCLEDSSVSDQHDKIISKLCCCGKDLCTRQYFQ